VNVFVSEERKDARKDGQEPRATLQDYAALMERRGSRALCPYSVVDAYTEGQYIAHPKFGEGYVLAMRTPPGKMEVLFEDKKRMLVCGRGSITGARKEEEDEPPQEEAVGSDKRSLVSRAKSESAPPASDKVVHPSNDRRVKRKSVPLANHKAARPSGSSGNVPSKCPVCGLVVHPFNLARAPDGRILGCFRCR